MSDAPPAEFAEGVEFQVDEAFMGGLEKNKYSQDKILECHATMTPEETNRRMILTPPVGCRNSFSSCNDGQATRDDLHSKDWDGSSPPRAGPGGASPTDLPSRWGALLDVGWGRC